MTLKNDRAPLLSNIKLCASFHHHMWIQTGVTARKQLSWVLTSVTLTFDLWPWPLAWTSLLSLVITPESFMMIRLWEHSKKGVTDGQTDRQTENTICRAAWSQLKTSYSCWGFKDCCSKCLINVLWYAPILHYLGVQIWEHSVAQEQKEVLYWSLTKSFVTLLFNREPKTPSMTQLISVVHV